MSLHADDVGATCNSSGSDQTVTTTRTFGPTAGDVAYQQFVDVTAIVAAQGNGRYSGANVTAGRGEDRYAGSSLIVVYRKPRTAVVDRSRRRRRR